MDRHSITWTVPQPLWRDATKSGDSTRPAMTAPTILRFATDDFMPLFLNVLATDPQRLGEYRVVRETWRGVFTTPTVLAPKKIMTLSLQRFTAARQRINGKAASDQGQKPQESNVAKELPALKLYQPAHQRYYLVTSSLVCQLAGLPDRKIDAAKHEQAGFLMRRLIKPKDSPEKDPSKWPEHAWVEKDGIRIWSPV